ncbi:MAG: sulfite exporter TauE/SafE family protein [Myxococcales bacterium]|nr:sulfite exporter TauE/SafE family protein [Myxococcales bacterium]
MPPEFFLAIAVLAAAATVQGFLGFGFGMAAMAGLTFTHDIVHASGVVNLTGGVLTSVMVWQLREHVDWPTVRRIVPALLCGVALGVFALGNVDREWMVRILGVTIVAISVWNLAAPSLQEHASLAADLAAGFLGGVLGGAFNTGGPPLIAHLYRREAEPVALKATIQSIFLGISLSRAPIAAASGLMGGGVWRDAATALPLAFVGLWAGHQLSRRLSPERFRRAAWLALGLLGVVLFVRA